MNLENQIHTHTHTVKTSISSFKEKHEQRGKYEPLILDHFIKKQQAASKSKNILRTLSPVFNFSTFHSFC